MRNILLIIFSLFVCVSVFSSKKDSIAEFQQRLSRQEYDMKVVKREINKSLLLHDEHKYIIDSLSKKIFDMQKEMSLLSYKTEKEILYTQKEIKESSISFMTSIKLRTIYGIIAIAFMSMVVLGLFIMLHRGHVNVDKLKQKADKLNEDILNQFSLDMVELQKITASLVALSSIQVSQTNNVTSDHSLIKTLADRITFMEMTLYKMDKGVRGYKQLSKSILQIKDNLKANGYELVDMLGKNYSDGMKVVANFIEDEELKEGEQIITSIIKPQINYMGVMIQSAQITVSQNL